MPPLLRGLAFFQHQLGDLAQARIAQLTPRDVARQELLRYRIAEIVREHFVEGRPVARLQSGEAAALKVALALRRRSVKFPLFTPVTLKVFTVFQSAAVKVRLAGVMS